MSEVQINTEALANLSEGERREMQSFIEQETGRLKMQSAISEFTEKCFPLCVKGSDLNAPCLQNCVSRYLDLNIHIIKSLNQMNGH
ncbi:Mitochondrial import inner membrane translocase subunit tim8 [Savitreella phatthalungensis]